MHAPAQKSEVEEQSPGDCGLRDMACSTFLRVLDVIGECVPAATTEALAMAAKQSGGILIVRYNADAKMFSRLYDVETVALSEISSVAGRILIWEPAAIHKLFQEAVRVLDK